MNMTPDVEQKLWTGVGVTRISDIAGFPLPNHDALRTAVLSGQAALGIEYTAARDLVQITKSPSAAWLTLALMNVMMVLAVGSFGVAFGTGNWWALGGVVSAFLGQAAINPYSPFKSIEKFLVACTLLHIIAVQSIVQGAAWVSFSFAASAISVWVVNRVAWRWAHEAVLASEAFAAYLFKTHNLHILDSHGRMHNAQSA